MIGTAIVIAAIVFSGAFMMCVATACYKRGGASAPIVLFIAGFALMAIAITSGLIGDVQQSERAALER